MTKRTLIRSLKLLLAGVLGALVARELGLPAGLFVGSMMAVAVLHLAGTHLGKAPFIYDEAGKILLGTAVGATLGRHILFQLGVLLPLIVVTTVLMIVVSAFLARVLARLTHLHPTTALFSLTPGGIAEMVAVAQEAGAAVTVVATLQFVRLSTVVIVVPLILQWMSL